MCVVAVRGDAGSRGAALRAAAACSKMHNSAFFLPLAALAHSTFPRMSHHNMQPQKSSCINSPGQTPSLLCPLSMFLSQPTKPPSHTKTHTSNQPNDISPPDKENRAGASHNETTTVIGLKISHVHGRARWYSLHKCSNGSSDAEQSISLNWIFVFFILQQEKPGHLVVALWRCNTSLVGSSQRADLPLATTNTQDGKLAEQKRRNYIFIQRDYMNLTWLQSENKTVHQQALSCVRLRERGKLGVSGILRLWLPLFTSIPFLSLCLLFVSEGSSNPTQTVAHTHTDTSSLASVSKESFQSKSEAMKQNGAGCSYRETGESN